MLQSFHAFGNISDGVDSLRQVLYYKSTGVGWECMLESYHVVAAAPSNIHYEDIVSTHRLVVEKIFDRKILESGDLASSLTFHECVESPQALWLLIDEGEQT